MARQAGFDLAADLEILRQPVAVGPHVLAWLLVPAPLAGLRRSLVLVDDVFDIALLSALRGGVVPSLCEGTLLPKRLGCLQASELLW